MPEDIVPIKPVSKDLLYMKVADAIHNYIHENKLHVSNLIALRSAAFLMPVSAAPLSPSKI